MAEVRALHFEFMPGQGADGLRADVHGRLETIGLERSIRQAIRIILSTTPGERVMRPDYGCDLQRLVFQPNDDTSAGLAMHYVRRALERWEPRIDLLSVDAHRDEAEPGVLLISLEYRIRSTQSNELMELSLDLMGADGT